MSIKQMYQELCATLTDARAEGDLFGHLRAWWETIKHPHDELVGKLVCVIFRDPVHSALHQDVGFVAYPVNNVPGYYAVDLGRFGRRVFHVKAMEIL